TLLPKVTDSDIGDITWSDHAPTIVELIGEYRHRGRPPWRLNDSLLHDHTFSQTLKDALHTYFQINYTPDIHPTMLWQTHKVVIQGLLISRASYVKKKTQEEYLNLLPTLRDTTVENIANPTPQQTQVIKDTTTRIKNMALAKTAHILHKLKQKSYSQGNRAGQHLATLLRQKQSNAKIPNLFTNKGSKIHNPQDINDTMATYYHSLYNLKDLHQPTSSDIEDFLQLTTLPTLSAQQKNTLQNPVTIQEIQHTIQSLPHGK
ncbi:Hypothetical predicted protein, partial [Pelobates cultripes]